MYPSLKHEGAGLEFGEAVGEEGFDGGENEDAVFACEEDGNIFSGKCLVFEQSLATGSARRNRRWELIAVSSAGCDGYGSEASVGIGRVGIEGACAFGACAGGIGGVFLIGAADNLAVGESDGCADVKFAVGRITAVCGLARCADEFLP